MTIEFPKAVTGEIRSIQVDGHRAFLIRGENLDVVVKCNGREEVVPEDDPDAVVAAVNRLANQPAY